jgi:methyl coenzyme M reductase beta subunit
MVSSPARGYAVIEQGQIDIRSVSPTRRAAIVNWLVTAKRLVATHNTTDEQIERAWQAHKGGAEAVIVTIIAFDPNAEERRLPVEL